MEKLSSSRTSWGMW